MNCRGCEIMWQTGCPGLVRLGSGPWQLLAFSNVFVDAGLILSSFVSIRVYKSRLVFNKTGCFLTVSKFNECCIVSTPPGFS